MNLNKLFEAQRKLDERIVKEKGLENEDLLDKKILALLVELGELANKYRGFKFWSEDQEPNTKVYYGPPELPDVGTYKNPLLEEYVDCLHFILSIGNNLGFSHNMTIEKSLLKTHKDILSQFKKLFYLAYSVGTFKDSRHYYEELLHALLGLGEML